jgi:ATP-binding cassette subfamily C protein LapB
LDQNWWRQQLAAVPQEPNLLDGTLLTNLKALRVNLGDEEIQSALNFVGLDKILNQSNDGLEMNVVSNNSQLSLGIRKRFALARAILINGKVVIMDEPTEGLDDQGAQAFYRYLNRCVEESRTVILLSHDKAIIKGADFVIDLNSKPTPKVVKT